MKYICHILLSLLVCTNVFARETHPILLLDNESSPVPGASYSLVYASDSTMIDGGITDNRGMIYLHIGKDPARYPMLLYVSCMGFDDYNRKLDVIPDSIILRPSSIQLGEVVVKAARTSFKREAGKFTFDPGALTKEMPNTYDVLKFTPLVGVSDDGVSILGKGSSRIFINGKDPMMSQSAVMEMLKATPPSQVRRIEIITEPGSSHSASMSGGIVNVILSQPNQGYRGRLSAGVKYEAGRLSPKAMLWNGFSYGKFNASLYLSYQGVNTNERTLTDYLYKESSRSVTNDMRNSGWINHLYGGLNMTYDLTTKSRIGISASLAESDSEANSRTLTTTRTAEGIEATSSSRIKTRSPFRRPNYGVRAFYDLTLDEKGSRLGIEADYASSLAKSKTDYDMDNVATRQMTDIDSRGGHAKAQADMVLTADQRLNVGYSYFRSRIVYDNDFQEQSNRFRYDEDIHSAFAQWNSYWSKAFTTSVGLRMEAETHKGHQTVNNERFRHTDVEVFPSLSISCNLPFGNQNISLDFRRRISRPFYDFMNPFVIWTSDNTYTKGNPDLKAYCSWDATMFYSFLENFTFGFTYSHTSDGITEYTYMDGDNTVTSHFNTGREVMLYPFLSFNKVFKDIWRLKAETDVMYFDRTANLNGTDLGYKTAIWSLNIKNGIVVSQKHRVRIGVSYLVSSPAKLVTARSKWKNLLSFDITKYFPHGWIVTLEANNLLNFKNDFHFSDAAYEYNARSQHDWRSVNLTVSYTFGKRKVHGASDNTTTELEQRFNQY